MHSQSKELLGDLDKSTMDLSFLCLEIGKLHGGTSVVLSTLFRKINLLTIKDFIYANENQDPCIIMAI